MSKLEKTTTISAMLLCLTSPLVQAESLSNFNYDIIEVGVGISDKQLALAGTKVVHPNAFLSSEVKTDMDDNYIGNIGLNFNAPITDWADIHGGIHGIRIERQNDNDESAWAFEFGYRQWISPQTEVFSALNWDYLEDSEIGGSLGGYFHATNDFSIGLKLEFNSLSEDVLMFSTKYDF